MAESSAYIIPNRYDFSYHFDGVVEIEYNFALNIDADPETETDVINGARKLPSQVRLSVVETDVSHDAGWAAGMLQAMDRLRSARTLCRVVTSMGTWDNMLLAEITATQDEENQFGWAGDLVFMQYVNRNGAAYSSSEASTRKTENNSAIRKNTGTIGPVRTVSDPVFRQIVSRGGADNTGTLIARMN